MPDRPIAEVVSNQFATEDDRDERGEAKVVMDLADIRPGMTVADIGAGEGYYTVRLGDRVGAKGRVLAQDIDRAVLTTRARAMNTRAVTHAHARWMPQRQFRRLRVTFPAATRPSAHPSSQHACRGSSKCHHCRRVAHNDSGCVRTGAYATRDA